MKSLPSTIPEERFKFTEIYPKKFVNRVVLKVLLESSDDEDEGSDLSDNEVCCLIADNILLWLIGSCLMQEEDGMDVWGGGYAEAHEKVL